LANHKRWLANFKREIEETKKMEADAMLNEEIKRLRIKKKAEETRKRIREENGQPDPVYEPPEKEPTVPLSPTVKKKEARVTFRDTPIVHEDQPIEPEQLQPLAESEVIDKKVMNKKKLPAWARTEEENEELEQNEEDQLLSFMDNLDYDSYIDDLEFKNMLQTLKKRVSELKEEPDWRDKWKKRLKEKSEKRKEEYLKEKEERQQDDDMITMTGNQGSLFGDGPKSVSSTRTYGKPDLMVRIYSEHQGANEG
jgi:hypothetical protein